MREPLSPKHEALPGRRPTGRSRARWKKEQRWREAASSVLMHEPHVLHHSPAPPTLLGALVRVRVTWAGGGRARQCSQTASRRSLSRLRVLTPHLRLSLPRELPH